MKKTLLSIAALFSFCVLSASAYANPVYGNWQFPTQSDNGMVFETVIGIAADSITANVVCKFPDGVTAQASVTTRAIISANTIQNLENKSVQSGDSNHTCTASSEPGSLYYFVNGDLLTLIDQGQSITLPRVR